MRRCRVHEKTENAKYAETGGSRSIKQPREINCSSLIVKNCALTLEQGRTKGQRQVQLAQQLTSAAPVLRDLDGGIVMGIYSSDGEELFRSPVSYGYGYTEGYGQGDLYYLDMSHFTDEEHIALTDWIITKKWRSRRSGWLKCCFMVHTSLR